MSVISGGHGLRGYGLNLPFRLNLDL